MIFGVWLQNQEAFVDWNPFIKLRKVSSDLNSICPYNFNEITEFPEIKMTESFLKNEDCIKENYTENLLKILEIEFKNENEFFY